MLKKVESQNAPAAIGPYSQAIIANGFLFCSGQLGIDPKTGQLVSGGVEREAEQVMKNLQEVLKAGGTALKDVVRCDIFLTDMNDFLKVNEIYASYFTADPKPARQTVEVAKLPKNGMIEISCIAFVE